MNRIILLLVIITISQIANGQVTIGPKAGLTFASQSYNSDYKVLNSGFEFGAMGNVPLTEQLYLEAEFLVTNKGYKDQFGDEIFDQLTTTYLQLPVLVQYRISHDIEYYGELGVYAARWTKGKYRSRLKEGTKIIEEEYSFTSDYNVEGFKDNRQEYGAILGIGMIYPISINHLVLDIRYNYGFTDVNNLENEPQGYEKRANRSLVISLGMLFYL